MRRTPKEWSRQLAGVMRAFSVEVKMLRELHIKIENQNDDDSESGDGSSTDHDSGHVITPYRPMIPNRSRGEPRFTGKLKLARWGAIPTRTELAHPAMYVLVGEIGSTECDELELPINISLPECVIVKSMRLLTYLDFNIHHGSLSWDEDDEDNVNFFVLCPFKLFVFFDHKIRRGLVGLEQHRRSITPASQGRTEQDYDAEWDSSPPSDGRMAGWGIDLSAQTLPEFTGLIKDLRTLVRFGSLHRTSHVQETQRS